MLSAIKLGEYNIKMKTFRQEQWNKENGKQSYVFFIQ